uniref:GATA transcription factor n=1 Tax=Opuntia streptacantha TaxID=393608 RepID=A0A7C9D0X1_OPUST
MEAADFFVEDLLDFSHGGDEMTTTDTLFDSSSAAANSTDSSISNSSTSLPLDSHFSSSLSLPYDEMAELEWLSNFVDESSFSTDPFHKFQLIPDSGIHPGPNPDPNPNPQTSVPGKARSKRSRVAPCDWSTRLLMVTPPTPSPASSSSSPSSAAQKKASSKRRDGSTADTSGEVRRCLHCAAEKTPQWRTGPMGPKTLCNACGVRYKSGRLVPEYRPAASPTFVSTKHSNSHRKVVELRRQKELQRHQQQQQFIHHQQSMMMAAGISNGGDDFLIHHHHHHHLGGHDYRQMI